jgi:hypothetical protein
MKDFSKEIINIDGVDYTLFLNRKGIVAWEKLTNASSKAEKIENRYETFAIKAEEVQIKDGDNPFELAGSDAEELEKDEKELIQLYIKLYWIMLYENHKLNITDVEKLWEQAESEYGADQLIELAVQMIDDANSNRTGNNELKNLKALRPKKN